MDHAHRERGRKRDYVGQDGEALCVAARSVGATIHELQHRLGHSSVTTTEAYLKARLLTDAEIQWALYGRPMSGEESTAADVA
jgi:integrase